MIARLTVRRGTLTEYPLAERTRGGWQNGVTFYPDADVMNVQELTVRAEMGELRGDLCEWCDMTARGNAMHPGHDGPKRSCGEKYHGESFEPDAESEDEE